MTITGEHHCCNVERELYINLEKATQQIELLQNKGIDYRTSIISINKTEKTVNGSSSYISYTITYGSNSVKRRYSEFESFRKILTRIYPTFIIPIIPEKHSIAQYAAGRSKSKEDLGIIKKRERMLGRFLGRIVEDPILSTNHIFHRFLENGISWLEIMHTPVLMNLPINPLYSSPSKANGSSVVVEGLGHFPKIAATNSLAANIPIPGPLVPLANPSLQWVSCKLFTNKFINIWSNKIDENFRKLDKKLEDIAENFAELGSLLNGLSLLEGPDVTRAIEYTGQVFDSSNSNQLKLKSKLDTGVLEYLLEYSKFSPTVNQVLAYRNSKNTQLEQLNNKMAQKKQELKKLLDSDPENHSSDVFETRGGDSDYINPTTPKTTGLEVHKFPSDNYNPEYSTSQPNQAYHHSGSDSGFSSGASNTLSSRNNTGLATGFDQNKGINGFGGSSDLDPLAQFQLEQSMIWNDGVPSAIPQNDYNPPSNQFTRDNSINEHYSHIGDDSLGIYSSNGSNLESSGEFGRTKSGTDGIYSSRIENEDGNKLKSQSMTTSRSEPLATTLSAAEKILTTPKSIGGALLNKLSNSLNGIVDANQDVSRQLKLSKLSESISEIEEMSETIIDDLVLIDESTQDNLNRFQKAKIFDLKLILVTMTNAHIEFNNRCLADWEKSRGFIKELID